MLQVESPGRTAERPTASHGLAKSTAKERFEVMAICASTISNLPDCSPGISPSQSLSMNWTSTPRSFASLRAMSIQKPLISPVFRSFHISGSYCSQEPTRNTPAFLIPSTVRPSACAPAAAVSEARPTQAATAIALIVFIYASLCSSCFTETTAPGGVTGRALWRSRAIAVRFCRDGIDRTFVPIHASASASVPHAMHRSNGASTACGSSD